MYMSAQYGLRDKTMKYIKIRDSKGNNRFIRLYSTKRSKNVIAVKTAGNETLYAGSGSSVSGPSVMKVQTASGVQNVCEYADSIPNTKLIAQYTTTQDVTLSKNLFPYGGMVVANGGKGTDSYGAGGKGSSARMYFGALLHNTILHVTIGVNNGSAGTSGTNTTVKAYNGDCIGGIYFNENCPDRKTISSSNATAGGAGGKGSRATLDYTGETINTYGGGGGGGNRGSIYYAYDCDDGQDWKGGYDCKKRYTTANGSFGSGGAAGNGTNGSGVSGGSAGSSENVSVAVYAFTE